MLLLVLTISVAAVWSVRAGVGAQRGLQGKIIVSRRTADCIQNAIFFGYFVVRYIAIWVQLIRLQIILALQNIWPISWLYTTNRITQQNLPHSVVTIQFTDGL